MGYLKGKVGMRVVGAIYVLMGLGTLHDGRFPVHGAIDTSQIYVSGPQATAFGVIALAVGLFYLLKKL
ncbi:MAG: hypothetical protein NT105_02625 [Verrucomicrobia bacterium]|nr:hypothetical protein [Verrucomicrobiota bacterium]